MTPPPAALVARAYAALHLLRDMRFVLADQLDAPAIYDRATNTIWIREDLTLDEYAVAVREAVDGLCAGTVVVDRDDGAGLAAIPRAVGDAEATIPTPRPSLRIV